MKSESDNSSFGNDKAKYSPLECRVILFWAEELCHAEQ